MRKYTGRIIIALALVMLAGMLGGCINISTANLVNTQDESLKDIDSIIITYTSERVRIKNGSSDKLILKEYMSKDDSSYYADVKTTNGNLTIDQGSRQSFMFNAYVDVYIPDDYKGKLSITTSSGKIDMDVDLELKEIYADSTSGEVEARNLKADNISLSSTSGKIDATEITADTCVLDTTSGKIEFGYRDIDDLTATSTSGKIEIALLSDFEGDFYAQSVSGKIETSFTDELSGNGKKQSGTIGRGSSSMTLKTTSGKIEVR